MNLDFDNWNLLSTLQRCLKKQFLLVEKEQQEKVKLKRQIQELVRSFHRHSIELSCPGGELLKEQGFDNCYNFIKDVIVTVSTDYRLGRLILFLSDSNTTLPSLVIHGLYENIETSDIFSKQITKLMFNLISELSQEDFDVNLKQKIIEAWKIFMQRVNILAYFEQIAEDTLKVFLRQNQSISLNLRKKRSDSPEKQNQRLNSKRPVQILDSEKVIIDYLEKIEAEAIMCPPSIKVALRTLGQFENAEQKVWKLMSYFYLTPFLNTASKSELPPETREQILHFIDQLVHNWGFTTELAYHSFQSKWDQDKISPRIKKICRKILQVNQNRWKEFVEGTEVKNSGQIQIKVLGGCLNLVQLYELLIMIQTNREEFSKISEKVTSRTLKIFEISPKLDILRRQRPAFLYASLSEFRYEEAIDSDYYRNYTLVYRGETLKQMLKQVLVQIQHLEGFRNSQRSTLTLLFSGMIENQESKGTGLGVSAQLLMKVKYLVCLLGREKKKEEEKNLMQSMMNDLEERNSINFRLFEMTKFSLLKVYCNLRNIKEQARLQRQSQKKAASKIKLIKRLEQMRLDICITSKASRNKSQSQLGDKYRYRLSTADEILVIGTNQCIHRQNSFTGRENHPHSVIKFLHVFGQLEEVRYYLRRPSFLDQFEDHHPYLYCNQAKIGTALSAFLDQMCVQLNLIQEQRAVAQEVIFRVLSDEMLGIRQQVASGYYDRCISEKFLSDYAKDMESPRKGSPQLKRKASFNIQELEEQKQFSGMHEELFTMGKRYLWDLLDLSSPQEKVRKLRDIVDIYKIAAGQAKGEEQILHKLITRTITQARMPNLVSQLAYLEMFVPEQRLMSTEGKVLRQFQKCVVKLIEEVPVRETSFKEAKVFFENLSKV